ncbi:hypothetical protein GCWU000324_02590 [Kingella oralis ATCC 51147]|uniref:Uncharacterized protein n=1 Tax=Kingella oralis ATCC 51147 TaxID=629741 RepID=C4GLL9_9NEIS|nr:hypothetical protein GCWU000324_02590 [Kingella oralis ATCC 51147]
MVSTNSEFVGRALMPDVFLNSPMFVGHQCPTYGLSDDLSGSLKPKKPFKT